MLNELRTKDTLDSETLVLDEEPPNSILVQAEDELLSEEDIAEISNSSAKR